jgi:hypothetical protein
MPKPLEFRLGIIGGCLSHQKDIPYSLLYHRQLADRLFQTTGVRLHVDIARDFERPYTERLDNLLANAECDGILLHVRSFSGFSQKAGVFVIYYMDDIKKYSLHPVLLGKSKMGWAQFASRYLGAIRLNPKNELANITARSELRHIIGVVRGDSNRILGMMLGLDRWAINDDIRMLQYFLRKCSEMKMPVVVLGPTPFYHKYTVNYLCRKMNKRLKAVLAPLNIPCYCFSLNTRHNSRNLMLNDDMHLNTEGHRFIADSLYETIEVWARNKIASKSI